MLASQQHTIASNDALLELYAIQHYRLPISLNLLLYSAERTHLQDDVPTQSTGSIRAFSVTNS